jgi:hypothetical protein
LPPAASAPLALLLLVSAPAARAGEVACWFDNGAVVVPAMVGGVAGDYILDTGTAHTVLAETQAQGAGFADTALKVEVRIAGLTLPDRPVAVLDLDPRSHAFPTPIAGVIGADILAGYVLEVSFAPCRVALYRPGRAPRFRTEAALPIDLAGGVPTLAAAVADGPHARAGRFVVATGADTAVRIDDRQAQVPGSRRPERLLTYGAARPRLRALSLAGRLWEEIPGGLTAHADLPDGALGVIGTPVLSAWRLRFDFPRRRLDLARAR